MILNKIKFLPYLFIGILLLPINLFSNWGPIDDWHMLQYLLNNISRTELINGLLAVGRFYPLFWSEWKLLSFIDINSHLFYFFNFIEAFVACSILYYILKRFSNMKTGLFLIFLLILSPAFVESYYRLGVPDKNSFFLFTIGIYFITNYLFDKLNNFNNLNLLFNLFFGSLLISLALYFKEPGFIMISMFSILFAYFQKNDNEKNFDKNYDNNKYKALSLAIIFLLNSFLFLSLYLSSVSSIHKTEYIYSINTNTTILSRIIQSLIVLMGYSLLDPLIIFAGIVLFLLRIINMKELNKGNIDKLKLSFADSAILAGFSYVLFYILYGIITYRYLFPAYVFILPAIAIYIDIFSLDLKSKANRVNSKENNINRVNSKENNVNKEDKTYQTYLKMPSKKVRNIIMVIFALLVINSITTGINLIFVYKYVPYNMSEFLEKSVPIFKNDISNNHNVNLFLIGTNRGSGVEYYDSMSTFLNISGINTNQMDMKSMDPIDSESLFHIGSKDLNYTAYRTEGIQEPISGDYLIMIPFNIYNEDNLTESIKEKYNIKIEQLYKSKNTYYFQIPNGIMLGRYIAAKMGIVKEVPSITRVNYSLYRVD